MKAFDEEFSAAEREELDLLATELHAAAGPAALSEDFHEQLAQRLQKSWSFRSAMDRSPLMRAAAGLLMVSLIAAPVAALVTLLRPTVEAPPTLGFEALPEFSEMERTSWGSGEDGGGYVIVGPEDEFDLPREPWSPSRVRALEQGNRLSLAGASLHASAEILVAEDPAHHDLWSLFLESCRSGVQHAPDAALMERIGLLQSEESQEDSALSARAAWHWVLTGETSPPERAPLAWQGAPFLD